MKLQTKHSHVESHGLPTIFVVYRHDVGAMVCICSSREHAERCIEEHDRRRAEDRLKPIYYWYREYVLDEYAHERFVEYWTAYTRLSSDKIAVAHKTEYRLTGVCSGAEVDEDVIRARSTVSAEHARRLASEERLRVLAKRQVAL